jgi:hypothetical protein
MLCREGHLHSYRQRRRPTPLVHAGAPLASRSVLTEIHNPLSFQKLHTRIEDAEHETHAIKAPTDLSETSSSMTASTSVATLSGSETLPTADLAWRPASPKTSTIKSEAPLIT